MLGKIIEKKFSDGEFAILFCFLFTVLASALIGIFSPMPKSEIFQGFLPMIIAKMIISVLSLSLIVLAARLWEKNTGIIKKFLESSKERSH